MSPSVELISSQPAKKSNFSFFFSYASAKGKAPGKASDSVVHGTVPMMSVYSRRKVLSTPQPDMFLELSCLPLWLRLIRSQYTLQNPRLARSPAATSPARPSAVTPLRMRVRAPLKTLILVQSRWKHLTGLTRRRFSIPLPCASHILLTWSADMTRTPRNLRHKDWCNNIDNSSQPDRKLSTRYWKELSKERKSVRGFALHIDRTLLNLGSTRPRRARMRRYDHGVSSYHKLPSNIRRKPRTLTDSARS